MTDLIDQLEQAAKAATPGPWKVADTGSCITVGGADIGAVCRIANTVSGRPLSDEDRANAALIALADPATILKLLAVVRAAEMVTLTVGASHALDDLQDALENLK